MTDRSWLSTHLALLLRVKDPRNETAWCEFVHKYRGPIVDYCRRRFRVDLGVADEIAQEVLVKLLQDMQRFDYDPDKSFRAWLKTVSKNAVLAYFRKEQKRLDRATGDTNVQELINSCAKVDGADAIADSLSLEMQRDLLEQAECLVRQRVDQKRWNAYVLRRAGEPARKIASKLQKKVAAVHQDYSRVKKMIREEIKLMLAKGPK